MERTSRLLNSQAMNLDTVDVSSVNPAGVTESILTRGAGYTLSASRLAIERHDYLSHAFISANSACTARRADYQGYQFRSKYTSMLCARAVDFF